MMAAAPIYFYGHKRGPYSCFSNFYPCVFIVDGVQYNCSEQYLMYQKCLMFDPTNADMLQAILASNDPVHIKMLGRQIQNYDDAVWAAARFNIMKTGLLEKFKQNPSLIAILRGTYDRCIYEAAKHDRIWGIGYNATEAKNIDPANYGQNLLGKSLMWVRDELKPTTMHLLGKHQYDGPSRLKSN